MFDDDKNLHIYQDKDIFEITLKWYTPIAWFLLFFSTIWCGFLFVFYGMMIASGEAPGFAYLFPLIHVAVGISMAYYTACLFLNKTYVDVVDNNLTVHHDPIPWWRGNVSIPIEDIDQLYVKEKVTRGKNGTSKSYALRAKLRDGKDKMLLNIGTKSSSQLQEIENSLEDFLGIQDQPVKGEYGVGSKWSNSNMEVPQRRKQRRGFSGSPLELIYLSEVGDRINLKRKDLEILSNTQYDWNDGNSDKLFQLSDKSIQNDLLFITQNRASLNAFEEHQVPLSKAYSIGFKSINPQTVLDFDGKRYTINHHSKGRKFVSGLTESIEVEQWKYLSADGQQMLRIIGNEGALAYYQGTVIESNHFEQSLDLNQIPKQIIKDESTKWDEGDFV